MMPASTLHALFPLTSMHRRNPYRVPPDFVSLSESYEPLKAYLIAEGRATRPAIDFRDEEALRCLTKAILLRDFDLRVEIPNDRLCPPVPNRLNYILWLQDIVTAHDRVLVPEKREIKGMDIGTGSTAIYPLLGCKWDSTWSFIATELDDQSFQNARENIVRNNLESRIDLQKASLDGSILFPLEAETSHATTHPLAFTMCNPPFYGSQKEIADSADDKELPPNAACTGADIEMIYPDGGESGFVGRMVDESIQFQTSCRWFTSMLGKLSSLQHVVQRLRDNNIHNYAVTEFVQGQTRRWAIGWSFLDMHLPDSVARIQSIGQNHPLYRVLPPRSTLHQGFSDSSSQTLWLSLIEVLESIPEVTTIQKIPFSSVDGEDRGTGLLLVEAPGNTWSRSSRRKTKKLPDARDLETVPSQTPLAHAPIQTQATPALTISIEFPPTQLATILDSVTIGAETNLTLEFQWIYGRDRALFESFVSHITRKVGLAVKRDHASKPM